MLNFMPVFDTKIAEWIKTSLEKPWSRQSDRNYVASIIPKGFPDYARILHPAYSNQDMKEIKWAEIADILSCKAHPQMQWHKIAQFEGSNSMFERITPPFTGNLPERQAKVLSYILRKYTNTPEECYFAIWDGWNFSGEKPWTEAVLLKLGDRNYYLVKGSIDCAQKSISPLFWQSASLWWPKDRSWCVATDIDLMCTYVGASIPCIEEILADKRVEAFRTCPDHRVDSEGDKINI